jgi:hypothetical protein
MVVQVEHFIACRDEANGEYVSMIYGDGAAEKAYGFFPWVLRRITPSLIPFPFVPDWPISDPL